MKTLKILFGICLALLIPVSGFCSTNEVNFGNVVISTDTGDATGIAGTYLAFGGAMKMQGATPVIRFASVTSDLAGARFYALSENGDGTTTDAAYSSGGKVLPVTATTAFDGTAGEGSWVAIYNTSTSKFEVNRVSSISAGVSLNLVRNTTNTYPSGSVVRELTPLYSVPVGNATVTFQGGILGGERGEVLGWYVDGTSACRINNVTAEYKQ